MTREEKQSELQRIRDIILATLDYLLSRDAGIIVLDEEDIMGDYYRQQKLQIEKYFKQRRLDRLQQRLTSFVQGLQNAEDFNFADYIKEKSNYDIDIFEDLRKSIDTILAQKEIRDLQELHSVSRAIHLDEKFSADKKMIETLRELSTKYHQQTRELKTVKSPKKTEHTEIINTVDQDGAATVTMRTTVGAKPKHLKEDKTTSPDGRIQMHVVQWGNGRTSSTYVNVIFPRVNGVVYALYGIGDIKAFWQDNFTIIINTKKEYVVTTQHHQVSSFNDVIKIIYVAD